MSKNQPTRQPVLLKRHFSWCEDGKTVNKAFKGATVDLLPDALEAARQLDAIAYLMPDSAAKGQIHQDQAPADEKLPETEKAPEKAPETKPDGIEMDREACTAELEGLKGIGPTLAKQVNRIIGGGQARLKILLETHSDEDEIIQKLIALRGVNSNTLNDWFAQLNGA